VTVSKSTLGEQTGLDLGHLQDRRDRLAHAHQALAGFELVDEVAQAAVGHGRQLTVRRGKGKRRPCGTAQGG
jgi:hypothetical protein